MRCLKSHNKVLGIKSQYRENHRVYDMRFLLYVIVIIPELSLVVVLKRRDNVNAERLAHVILLD